MKRALALFVVCALGACAGSSAETPQTSTTPAPNASPNVVPATATVGMRREPTYRERLQIRPLFAQTERIRGLRLAREVRIAIADDAYITHHLTSQIEEDELVASGRTYVALGLLSPEVDLRALLTEVLGEQVVGFYDPKEALLVIREDVMVTLGRETNGDDETRIVIIHELVHAIQDQHFDLQAGMDRERDTDGDNAYHSVVEGDATLAMLGYVTEARGMPLSAITQSPELLSRIGATQTAAGSGGESLARAPAILRVSLVAPYTRGLAFCAALHAVGGFSGIDGAFRTAPASMEQVMHPQKYMAQEAPIAVRLPELAGLASAGYTVADEDTLGEMEIGVYLALGTPHDTNDAAAAGWGGDRLRVYSQPNGPAAVVWRMDWDTEADAEQAERAANVGLGAIPAANRARFLVTRRGRSLLVLREIAPELQADIAAAVLAP